MRSTVLGLVVFALIVFLVSACAKTEMVVIGEVSGPSKGKRGMLEDERATDPFASLVDPDETGQFKAPCADTRANLPSEPVFQRKMPWCWVASAKMVMAFHNAPRPQCELYSTAYRNRLTNAGVANCCAFDSPDIPDNTAPDPTSLTTGNFTCLRSGWPGLVFNRSGLDFSLRKNPLEWEGVKDQLCRQRPFIFIVTFRGGGGHSQAVKGFVQADDSSRVVIVDDHLNGIKDVPYECGYAQSCQQTPTWNHYGNYINIRPSASQ